MGILGAPCIIRAANPDSVALGCLLPYNLSTYFPMHSNLQSPL